MLMMMINRWSFFNASGVQKNVKEEEQRERVISVSLVFWCLITINLQPRYECHAAFCGRLSGSRQIR